MTPRSTLKLDSTLTFQAHINRICKIILLKPLLLKDDTEKLVHALTDYCNALILGLPAKSISHLQLIQNSAARALTGSIKSAHKTPILAELHWLPVQYRIQFKVLILTYKAFNGQSPSYLSNLITIHKP